MLYIENTGLRDCSGFLQNRVTISYAIYHGMALFLNGVVYS